MVGSHDDVCVDCGAGGPGRVGGVCYAEVEVLSWEWEEGLWRRLFEGSRGSQRKMGWRFEQNRYLMKGGVLRCLRCLGNTINSGRLSSILIY